MKKFFRLAIVFAIAGAALLTGCTKDYGADISSLQTNVNKLLSDVKTLQDQVKDGIAIKDVRPDGNGGVIIELANGKTFNVEKGAKGADAPVWTIGNDGYWYKDGSKTDNKAIGKDGKDADVWTIGNDGYWYKNNQKTDKKAIGADGKDADVWTIGNDGYWYKNNQKTDTKAVGADGKDADVWFIGEDGYWYKNNEKTDKKAIGADGKDADVWTIGEDGFWYKNNEKTEFKAVGKDADIWTIGEDGFWYKNGEKTANKANGKDGAEWTIGEDGFWYKNGEKTEKQAIGNDGADGDYWQINADDEGNLYFEKIDGATGEPAVPEEKVELTFGDNQPVTAVWEDGKLTLYNVKDALGPVVINLTAYLKSIAFVPEVILDGLGLIEVFELYSAEWDYDYVDADGYEYAFARVSQQDPQDPVEETFIGTAPTVATYRLNPQLAKAENYDFKYIAREVETRAASEVADDYTFAEVVGTPVQNGSFLDVTLKLNDAILNGGAATDQDNDIIALEATCIATEEGAPTGEVIVSDYQYLDKTDNVTYKLIDKPTWDEDETVKDHIVDYIPVKNNGADSLWVEMKYDEQLDLRTLVETYANEINDLASVKGIVAEYEFYFAGLNDDGEVTISKIGANAPYIAATIDGTNQNEFVRFTDDPSESIIEVDPNFVNMLTPAVNRTPLIYVLATYEGAPLADAFIKIKIVKEWSEEPGEDLGWDVFITHDITISYADLVAAGNGTSEGESGEMTAPRTEPVYVDDEDYSLVVDWWEMNKFVFNDPEVDLSYEIFAAGNGTIAKKYNADAPKLILIGDDLATAVVPTTDECPDKDEAVLDDLTNIGNWYNGVSRFAESPANWNQSTNILSLTINEDVDLDAPVYVYVLYEPVDNAEYPGVVVRFSFGVEKHDHEFSLFDWQLNPDYTLGDMEFLNEDEPADYTESASPYDVYGAVRVKGTDAGNVSAFIEHFKEYGVSGMQIPVVGNAVPWYANAPIENNVYRFEIMNYAEPDVIIQDLTGVLAPQSYDRDGDGQMYWYVDITAEQLLDMIALDANAAKPEIVLANGPVLGESFEILVKVTETCELAVNHPEAVEEASAEGYYYVVFQSLQLFIEAENVELGTFKDWNDFAYSYEFIKDQVVVDAAGEVVFEWRDTETDPAVAAGAEGWYATQYAEDNYGYAADAAMPGNFGIIFDDEGFGFDKVPVDLVNDDDTKESFGGRLIIVDGADMANLTPVAGALAIPAVNWYNMGTDLQVNKYAFLNIQLVYYPDPANTDDYNVISEDKALITVLATENSVAPRHQ